MAAWMPCWLAAATPTRMNPAWAIEEYASIRFTLVWAMASTLPTTIVTAATPHRKGFQSHASGDRAARNTRRNAPNAATLVPADMNPATLVGAPWLAAGVHRR